MHVMVHEIKYYRINTQLGKYNSIILSTDGQNNCSDIVYTTPGQEYFLWVLFITQNRK